MRKLSKTFIPTPRTRTLLLTGLFSCSAIVANVKTENLTITLKDATLEEAISIVSNKLDIEFAYSPDVIDIERHIDVDIRDLNLEETLESMFGGSSISWEIANDKVYLTKEQKNTNSKQQPVISVSGIVTDASGEPIIGANILVEGETEGTVSDYDGRFTIKAAVGDKLKISYIGYIPQVITLDSQKTLNIKLKEDTQALEEVVVVGYGTMKKRDLTGAVSSVKMSDEPVSTVSTISHALAGKAAGLQVSTVSAQPGGGASFRIRGAASSDAVGNDPLIIIDGFPVSDPGELAVGKYDGGTKDNILASINPNDIESIEVLKDASSTAIYGARAGNGVIIITTKRGKAGAPVVKYSGSASVQDMSRTYEMLNPVEFMKESNRFFYETWKKNNGVAPYGTKNPAEIEKPYTPHYSDNQIANPANETDWFDEITRMGFQTQHNISINGGTDATQYLISGNYFNQEGVVKDNDMTRYALRVNLDQKLNDWIKTGVNLTVSRNNYNNVPLGVGQNENAGIMVSAAQFNPLLGIKDENGDYILNQEAAFLPNPVSLLEITDETVKERLLGNVFLELEPIKDLRLKANVGIDRNYQKRSTYLPKTTLYGAKEGGKANIGQADKSDYLIDLTANYNKSVGVHNFGALLGHSYQIFDNASIGVSNNQFLIDGFLFNNIGAGSAPKPGVSSSASRSRMSSFFGRFNYSMMDRYLLTATLRADGSSNFAKNNRWGYFPSVALGWRFSEENFMRPLDEVVSNAKLRISYGETGNANIGNRAISFYKTGNNNEFGGTQSTGVYLSQLGNQNLKWETTREWNFGLDLGLFNNRINITAEYFHKIVSDLLSTRSLLSFQEVSSIADNIGKTKSTGFEVTVNTQNIVRKDFSWNTDLTLSAYKDKWEERSPSWKPSAYSIYDAPLRGSYGYLSDGLIQIGEEVPHMKGGKPGQIKIKDIDGFQYDESGKIKYDDAGKPLKTGVPDGKLDDADKVFYGSSDPKLIFGFNNTFRYKNFDLNFYLYGQFGKMMSGSYKDLWLSGADGFTGVANIKRGYNMPVSAKDIWSSDNTSGTRPGYFQSESSYGIGDFYMQKTWFVRMRNITLGYNIPVKKYLSNIRVYADVNNPFVITPYDGLDPETDSSVWAYPNIRTYSLGIDITF